MKVKDILEKMTNREEGEFEFYVKCMLEGESHDFVNWKYENGLVMSDDELGFHWYTEHVYSLDDEIVVIENEEVK